VPERFDPCAEIPWTTVNRWQGRAERFVPAELCYLGVPGRFYYANTNGCAAADSRADAMLRALYELAERDAVALWWYSRARRPRIKVDHPAATIMERARRKFWVLDLTHDLGIPSRGGGVVRSRGPAIRRNSAYTSGASRDWAELSPLRSRARASVISPGPVPPFMFSPTYLRLPYCRRTV
jgi:hypothetical protein